MKLQFNAEQPFQLRAVESVVRLFEGLDKFGSDFSINEYEVVPNLPETEELWEPNLLENLQAVQDDNGLRPNRNLEVDEGETLLSLDAVRYPSFSVEMETGTGKTYVYLRTIYELHQQYGFGKFVLVVPSVAIYQGVKTTFKQTKDHFAALYDKPIVHLIDYDGNNVQQVKRFATSTACEILLITLDAFNRKANNLYKPTDKLPGSPLLPYEYVAQTRPILVLDEPQNMEGAAAAKALRTLRPLLALRYSATHKTTPNLVYRLTPVEAFRQGLVKRVEVAGITENDNYNEGTVALLEVKAKAGSTPTAVVQTVRQQNGERKPMEVTLRVGQKLRAQTGLEEHEDFVVDNISAVPGDEYISFKNEVLVPLHATLGSSRPAVFRAQIRQTVREHLRRQAALLPHGIKVLSLFFIDRVANYVDGGIIQRIFDEEYEEAAKEHTYFKNYRAAEVRDAYFASYRKGNATQPVYVETEEANLGADKDARKAQRESFELIMRSKETLLTLPTRSTEKGAKVAFIFAHSALKEGWDNPNVFQICTLNHTISERKKRQEIGRGMRLAVNQEGQRVSEAGVNALLVVANESYESYVRGLQREYTEEGKYTDSELPPQPSNAKQRKVKRNDAVFQRAEFRQMWARLSKQVDYRIEFDPQQVIKRSIEQLQRTAFPLPKLSVKRGQFVQTEIQITLLTVSGQEARLKVELLDTRNLARQAEFNVEMGQNLSAGAGFKQYLEKFKVEELTADPYNARLKFSNGYEVTQVRPLRFVSELGAVARPETTTVEVSTEYPVFDVVGRASRETRLTRRTVQTIFAGLTPEKKQACLKNPEGFAEKFISVIKNVLAEQVAENLVFEIVGDDPMSLDELFPIEPKFVQDRLLDAGTNSIYNQVQIDSGVEARFVEHRMRDMRKVLFYFKFPKRYCIDLPRIIRNYNPDWGVVYEDIDQQTKLELVRETKGSMDKEALRFEHEKLKITCAERYYRTLGIDYRQITDQIVNWQEPAGSEVVQGQVL
ncbi:type III restriction endonuclease subunit R [Hymenobacter setariae]|uniref:Type III restriction endonuclease subunit R n=1 Tax=Hymenobacter setariae TaxID=2594794 RepID=A0A558BJR2_9BACT|nr:DEAD/DEAH box helicase family protein [Hymenobacter setariae]TVT36752.1 type III restriction endonuclease subunit R [Hymenobacter setariae]